MAVPGKVIDKKQKNNAGRRSSKIDEQHGGSCKNRAKDTEEDKANRDKRDEQEIDGQIPGQPRFVFEADQIKK